MVAAPLIPYLPTERLVIPLLGEGAIGGRWPTAPIAIQPFGLLVATGVYVGAWAALRQARRVGLDEGRMVSFITWVVGVGFLLAHLLEVLFCRPDRILDDPLVLLRLWDGISSFGGFIGGVVGALLWRLRTGERFFRYADAVASALPVGWVLGRAGCAVAHDHPGLLSDAWFAVQFPDGGRFDLGLYEMVLMLPLAAASLWLRRAPRPAGFFLALISLYYAPVRFCLDFLRAYDARYWGLTPAQWGSIALLFVGFGILTRSGSRSPDRRRAVATGAGREALPIDSARSSERVPPAARRAERRAARGAHR